jgi:hypothetical protein
MTGITQTPAKGKPVKPDSRLVPVIRKQATGCVITQNRAVYDGGVEMDRATFADWDPDKPQPPPVLGQTQSRINIVKTKHRPVYKHSLWQYRFYYQ